MIICNHRPPTIVLLAILQFVCTCFFYGALYVVSRSVGTFYNYKWHWSKSEYSALSQGSTLVEPHLKKVKQDCVQYFPSVSYCARQGIPMYMFVTWIPSSCGLFSLWVATLMQGWLEWVSICLYVSIFCAIALSVLPVTEWKVAHVFLASTMFLLLLVVITTIVLHVWDEEGLIVSIMAKVYLLTVFVMVLLFMFYSMLFEWTFFILISALPLIVTIIDVY